MGISVSKKSKSKSVNKITTEDINKAIIEKAAVNKISSIKENNNFNKKMKKAEIREEKQRIRVIKFIDNNKKLIRENILRANYWDYNSYTIATIDLNYWYMYDINQDEVNSHIRSLLIEDNNIRSSVEWEYVYNTYKNRRTEESIRKYRGAKLILKLRIEKK